MPYICIIDSDQKSTADVTAACSKVPTELAKTIKSFPKLAAFEEFTKKDLKPEDAIQLIVIAADQIVPLTEDALKKMKDQYKTDIMLLCFDDPLKPLKKTETWPVENILYKPFDPAILQEHIRFSMLKSDFLKTESVHSAKEKHMIEKIRRQTIVAISDFGFKLNTKTKYEIGQPYKFYHSLFLEQRKQSVWAKPINQEGDNYDFVFCTPTLHIITTLRKKILESKSKLRASLWNGSPATKMNNKPQLTLQFQDQEEMKKIKDYFERKFPDIVLTILEPSPQKPSKKICDLLISDQNLTDKNLESYFIKAPVYIRVGELVKSRDEAMKSFKVETARVTKPVDRNFIGRMVNSFFPLTKEVDSTAAVWTSTDEKALQSDLIESHSLSEAALIYFKSKPLTRGSFQEFALPKADEIEIDTIKAKVQFVSPNPGPDKMYQHQVVFYGVRDQLLKQIRLWMLQSHINSQNKI